MEFMEKIRLLIDSMIFYFQSKYSDVSVTEYFITYWIPIIQIAIVFLGTVGSLWKYFQVKNRDINEKILSEIYAPLYNYFIKQELYCHITKIGREFRESPIIGIQQTINGVATEDADVLGLNRKYFIEKLNNINIGLASKELYTLLSMYEVACYIEENHKNDKTLEATILKVEIENNLREEILNGYSYYHKKLGLSSKNIKKMKSYYKIEKAEIKFVYEISETKINEVREQAIKEANKQKSK